MLEYLEHRAVRNFEARADLPFATGTAHMHLPLVLE